jgi:tetratricopeptide (TPR) repeat protein
MFLEGKQAAGRRQRFKRWGDKPMRTVNENRRGGPRSYAGCGFIGLLLMLSVVAGCATGHKSGPAPEDMPAVSESGSAVTHFGGERKGFHISERADMAAKWRASFEQAVAMLEMEGYAEAIALLEPVILSSPSVTAPYIDMAIACRHAGKTEQAEKYLKISLDLVPGHPVASNEYGLLLRRAGRFAEARAVYEKSLADFPEYLPLRRNLGILCDLYLGDQACAMEQYRIYKDGRPEDEQVKMWIADLSLRMGVGP